MKISIINKEDFKFLNGKSFNDLNLKQCQVSLKNKNLTFSINEIDYAILVCGECLVQRQDHELIFFQILEEKTHKIFTLEGNDKFDKELQRWIRRRNGAILFQSPLVCEYNKNECESPFSQKDEIPDLRGFLNGFILFGLVNYGKLLLHHFIKYGSFFQKNLLKVYNTTFSIHIFMFLSLIVWFWVLLFSIQKIGLQKKISEKLLTFFVFFLHLIYLSLAVLIVIHYDINWGIAMNLNVISLCFFQKGISYCHVLYSIRFYAQILNKEIEYDEFRLEQELSRQNKEIIEKHLTKMDQIITFKNLIYFIFAPTLCYQLIYPKNQKIRKIWLAKKVVQLLFCFLFQLFIILEFWYPILKQSTQVVNDFDFTFMSCLKIIELVLNLSIPMVIIWLLGFYYVFHVFLNILAEILQFADRGFYEDWWNCRTLQEYWKKWNVPVHQWFLRHVYYPLQYRGFSRNFANTIIFLLSAAAHEYWISVSIGKLGWLCFFSFNMQYVYIIGENIIMKRYGLFNTAFGNVCFWWNLCVVGQPIMAIVYYRDYLKKYQ